MYQLLIFLLTGSTVLRKRLHISQITEDNSTKQHKRQTILES